jgi:sulfate adenylyltransferase subunit 1 (EFTu-like GTPase family)
VQSSEYPTQLGQGEIQRIPASASEGQNRTVASKSEELDNQDGQSTLNVFWLIMALGLIGGMFRMNNRRAHK